MFKTVYGKLSWALSDEPRETDLEDIVKSKYYLSSKGRRKVFSERLEF